jgi:hypothetical protein
VDWVDGIDSLLNFWRTVCYILFLPPFTCCALVVTVLLMGLVIHRLKRNRWQFKLRTFLFAVAVVGLLLGGLTWGVKTNRRGTGFIMRAVHYGGLERKCQVLMHNPGTTAEEQAALKTKADYYARLNQKYHEAWSHPWKPVPPDPPPPD